MYRIYVGSISEARKKKWDNKDDNPYDVYEGKSICNEICDIYGVLACKNHLRDEIPIDWGSWAYKGNSRELEELYKKLRWDFSQLRKELEDGKDYAVVFVEED